MAKTKRSPGRPAGSKGVNPKPAGEVRAPLPFRIKLDLIDRLKEKATEHGLPASVITEILIARGLEEGTLERVFEMTEVRS
jgi:hypothetical protein